MYRDGNNTAQRHPSVGDQQSLIQVPMSRSPRASSRPTPKPVSGTSNVSGADCSHQNPSKDNPRALIDETPRSSIHRNHEPHPISHMRITTQDRSSQRLQHMQRGNSEGSATNSASAPLHHYPVSSGVEQSSPERLLHSHVKRHTYSESHQISERQARISGEFEKVSKSGAGQSNVPSLQQFTDADIGTNSAALLSKATVDKSQSIPPFQLGTSSAQGAVTTTQERNPPSRQSHGDRNISQRVSRGSSIGEAHDKSSRESLPDDHDRFSLQEHQDFHTHSSRQVPQERYDLNLTNESTNSEYADLPQFFGKRSGVQVRDHPFLNADFTESVELPRRVAELQGSSRPAHPVREGGRQNVYYALGNRGGNVNADPTPASLKTSSKIPKSVHEDSGINSPAYLQQ